MGKAMYGGDLIMDRDGTMSGMVGGDVVVRTGCDVRISGMVRGDVHVEEGATVRISGMVAGRIVAHRGRVHVTGMVG